MAFTKTLSKSGKDGWGNKDTSSTPDAKVYEETPHTEREKRVSAPSSKSMGPKRQTPLGAIRRKCLDCCCWQQKEVELCPSVQCDLWPYRFGKGIGTRERQAEKRAEKKAEAADD